jgi:glyoxylate/hydroxypyruvate reductase
MKVLLAGRFGTHEETQWRRALAAAAPDVAWIGVDELPARAGDVQAAVVANPPRGCLQGLPRLSLVQCLWAGVDKLLADPTIPHAVPLARMVDPGLTAAMVETALWAVISLHRGFFDCAVQQQRGEWVQRPQRLAGEVSVLVLGAGTLGHAVAAGLQPRGYAVSTWRRDGAPLELLLAAAQIVVDLLPLTPDTRSLLDARFFAALPRGASVVNLARGAHVVDADLIAALDSHHLHRAVLDVFHTEPLPPGHAFWTHPQVTVLPHVAALTDPRSAAAVVAQNLQALRDGAPLAHLVDRSRGY